MEAFQKQQAENQARYQAQQQAAMAQQVSYLLCFAGMLRAAMCCVEGSLQCCGLCRARKNRSKVSLGSRNNHLIEVHKMIVQGAEDMSRARGDRSIQWHESSIQRTKDALELTGETSIEGKKYDMIVEGKKYDMIVCLERR